MQLQLDSKHLIGYGLAIVLALGLVYDIEARKADKAESKADAAVATAQLLQKQNADFQASVQAQINQLLAANSSLSSALAAQKKKDTELSPNDLGNRLADLIQLGRDQVHTNTDGSFALSSNAVLQSVMGLEEVPVLREQLSNETKALSLEQSAHKKDVETCKATTDTLQLEVKAAKADARKGKMKWFGLGVIAGFIGRGFAGF